MLFFENRQLKKEIIMLDKKFLQQREEFNKCDKNRREHATELTQVKEELKKYRNQLEKISSKLREQTGADLLVNALKELGIIPLSEKEPDHFKEATRLQNQMSAMQNQQSQLQGQRGQSSNLGGLFGGTF